MKRTRQRLWMRRLLGLALIVGTITGCGPGGVPLPDLGGERMRLSVEASGVRPVPKTVIGDIPLPTGGLLAALLFDAHAGPFIERTTNLDHCRLVSTQEPPDPDALGRITLSGTSVCRLGPSKLRVRQVVTLTLEPLPADAV